MARNIGTADRVLRIIVGVGLIALGLTAKTWWGVLGIIPLSTAFVGFCPLYTVLGVSTCPAKDKH